ncbi:hypothetical protein CBW46_016585 [Paenibacillus xerothermodurans]|uniref:Uncharacterized protein n=1 Tax=Paenibacillus xerothermodurans TaxID=1977292 RepID=A0A2W1NL89_PAEXE|nr:hypothetical protein CBW46_016585 [Paenibacillus xerothermodurans]
MENKELRSCGQKVPECRNAKVCNISLAMRPTDAARKVRTTFSIGPLLLLPGPPGVISMIYLHVCGAKKSSRFKVPAAFAICAFFFVP